MEQENSPISDDEELKTNQLKLKAQEIAKRYEKYQGRSQTSSSRCNTPLPGTSADSMESIHSNNAMIDTREKIVKFRQFLQNDRKLVEDSKIDEQIYDIDDQDNNAKLLPSQIDKEKLKANYENIISDKIQEKYIQSLKSQVFELNGKLDSYHKIIIEKDDLLEFKKLNIESLDKIIKKNNKLHMENIQLLEKKHDEAINDERLKYAKEINNLEETLVDLKNNFEFVRNLYDKGKDDINDLCHENKELQDHNKNLLLKVEELKIRYENEKQNLLKRNKESSKQITDDIETKLSNLQQENDVLMSRVISLEKESTNTQEKDDLLMQLNEKETQLKNVQQEYDVLINHVSEKESLNTNEKDNLLTQLKDKETKLGNVQHEYDLLMNRVAWLETTNNQEKEHLLHQLNDKEKQFVNIQQEYDLLKNRITLLENEPKNTQENDNLLNELNDKEITLVNLLQENELLMSKISSLEKESMNTQEKDNLLSQLDDKETKLTNIQQEYDLLKNRITLLESTNNQEKQKLLQQLGDKEIQLVNLHQENNLLMDRISLIESEPLGIQEKESLVSQLNVQDAEIQHLSLQIESLNKQLQNQTIESQQTESRWVQLKDAYLSDRDRMTFLEKVINELKINNDELNNDNIKLSENIDKLMKNVTVLQTENSAHQTRIADLMTVIENMNGQFEKVMKETSNEYELNKKQFIQQHQDDTTLLTSSNKKIEQYTIKLNEITNQLDVVLKENDNYKCELLKLNNCLSQNDKQMWDLNNIINELHQQTSNLTNELEILKKENILLSNKCNKTNFETEESKLFSERFQKQKQLLKLKMKALKESENNCLLLQQQVSSLTNEIKISNQQSENLVQNIKQYKTVLQHCDIDLQESYNLLNNILIKSNSQNQNIYTLRYFLMSLASLFSFDNDSVELDVELLKIVDSICTTVPNDNELQFYLKKIVLGSIHMLEYTINLNNQQMRYRAESIARIEVDKLVSDAVEKVKISTQNEYCKQNNELLSLIENLQNDNRSLKLNTSCTFETKEVLTDLNGPTVEALFILKNTNLNNVENSTLIQILNNLQKQLQSINISETDSAMQIMNFLSEFELQINSKIFSNNKEKVSLIPEDLCMKQLNKTEANSAIDSLSVQGDSKILLSRYKNLKTRFKEVRARTVELDKQILGLTSDLESSNLKNKLLHDQYVKDNLIHEADIANYQSEIENLMFEKVEACRQLTAIKEKHEILHNDYNQLKSNLDNVSSIYDTESLSSQINEQNAILKRKLDDIQHLIDSTYSRVLCEWPPIDTNSDWLILQSNKLDKIVYAKCNSFNSDCNKFNGFEIKESEIDQFKKCVQIIQEMVTFILTTENNIEESFTNVLEDLMTDLKSCTEKFLKFISNKNNKLNLVNEHIELTQEIEDDDIPYILPEEHSDSDKPLNKEITKSSSTKNKENQQVQRSIAERDRLIEFLSDKISKLNNLNRNVDDIRSVREKLDRALTAVHDRDVRCDELTLELTRLLEERDMLQLKLSNSIRQIQLLSGNKPQLEAESFMMEENDGLKAINEKLEELHSLEYRRDADLFNDQEQRHMSQMKLHENGSTTQGTKSSNVTEEVNSSLSWIKDILW